MTRIQLPVGLRILIWVLMASTAKNLLVSALHLPGRNFAATAAEIAMVLCFAFFMGASLAGIPYSIRVMSWIGRIWGLFALLGTLGLFLPAFHGLPMYRKLELLGNASLYVAIGFWLGSIWKRWYRTSLLPHEPELEVPEGFVSYPRQ